jgi:hypothetical protein
MKRWDILLIIALLLVGGLLFALSRLGGFFEVQGGGSVVAEIYVDGALYQTERLTEPAREVTITTEWGVNVLEVGSGGVKMLSADCKSQACVHTARQYASGGVIACLPHKVLIKVSSDIHDKSSGEVDAIAG